MVAFISLFIIAIVSKENQKHESLSAGKQVLRIIEAEKNYDKWPATNTKISGLKLDLSKI